MEKKTPSVKELHEAVKSDNTELVAELLQQGVDPNGTKGRDRYVVSCIINTGAQQL